jgi:hypothetical protein
LHAASIFGAIPTVSSALSGISLGDTFKKPDLQEDIGEAHWLGRGNLYARNG